MMLQQSSPTVADYQISEPFLLPVKLEGDADLSASSSFESEEPLAYSDWGTHQPPVVVLPEQRPEEFSPVMLNKIPFEVQDTAFELPVPFEPHQINNPAPEPVSTDHGEPMSQTMYDLKARLRAMISDQPQYNPSNISPLNFSLNLNHNTNHQTQVGGGQDEEKRVVGTSPPPPLCPAPVRPCPETPPLTHTLCRTAVARSRRVSRDKGPFACEFEGCGKVFTLNHRLQRHRKTHSDTRPHACMYHNCDRAFHRLCDLKVHWRVHTGERPYRCNAPGCESAFTQPSALARHKRAKHKNLIK